MGTKRRNENSQTTKEEYDQLAEGHTSRGDSFNTFSSSFERPDQELISRSSKRRTTDTNEFAARSVGTGFLSSTFKSSSSNSQTNHSLPTTSRFVNSENPTAAISHIIAGEKQSESSSSVASKNPFASIQLKAPPVSFGTSDPSSLSKGAPFTFSAGTNPSAPTRTSDSTSTSSVGMANSTTQGFKFGATVTSNATVSGQESFAPFGSKTGTATSTPIGTNSFIFGTTSVSTTTGSTREKTSASNDVTSTENNETSTTVSKYSKYAIELDKKLIETAKVSKGSASKFTETMKHYMILARAISVKWHHEESKKLMEDESKTDHETQSQIPTAPMSFGNFGSSKSAIASFLPTGTTDNKTSAVSTGFFVGAAASSSIPPNTNIGTSSGAPALGTNAENDNDDDGLVQSEPTVPVETIQDTDWDTIFSSDRLRFYRLSDPRKPAEASWTSFAFGKLNIQRSTTSQTTNARMIMRDETVGRVVINIGIRPGMKFVLSREMPNKTTPSKAAARKISFSGINDSDRGYEGFIIKALPETAVALHQKLQELSN